MIKCRRGTVIVELIDLKPKKGSLLLTQEKFSTGLVISLGDNVDSSIELHDIAYFYRDSGIKITINERECIILTEDSILATWKDK